ncbi:trypco2 family protein [Streptomyces nanshensis]|uniref:trypco2 family protein n=1 Tax=Streptomyces nanshensis TaxID=518642 RepID=UPI00085BB5A7|nr:trypco2 family protein [Streptomyces nanshensis]
MELSEAIKAVREGLEAAQRDGAGSDLRFRVKDVVLDLGIELRKTSSAGGSMKAFVVSGEARGERSTAQTHRMTVSLELEGASLRPISDQGHLGETPGGRPFA